MNKSKLASLIPTAALVILVALGALLNHGGFSQPFSSESSESRAMRSAPPAQAAGLALTLLRPASQLAIGFIPYYQAPAEDPPSAVDDTDETDEDTPVSTEVTANDILDSNVDYVLTVAEQPGHGAAIHDGLLVTYSPDPDFNGTDGYQYQICGTGEGGQCSTAMVTITVNPVNDPPVAADDFVPMNQSNPLVINVLKNDTDIDGDALKAVLDAQPTHGSVVLNNDSTFTYTPEAEFNGLDNFSYHANDGKANSNQAEVLIDVAQPDIENPTLTWVAPVSDTEVYILEGETVVLEVEASDNQNVDYVQFRRWDVPTESYVNLGVVDAAPYRLELDASSLNVSWNQINARAVDTSGNSSGDVYIWLIKSMSLYLPVARR